MTDKEFIKSMAQHDSFLDHDIETCGLCYHNYVMAEVAREMLQVKEYNINSWSEKAKRRWEEGKFFQLYQEEMNAGRDPRQAFKDRGWEM